MPPTRPACFGVPRTPEDAAAAPAPPPDAAPPDQNGVLGISLATAAGVGAATNTPGVTATNPNYPAALAIPAISFATTAPTFGSAVTDPWQASCSSRGGIFDNWEQPDEWQVIKGVTNGLVFVNRQNALTTPLAWKLHVEWEE